jgi:hypothetical protein
MMDMKKIGGLAALGHTTALVVGMILSFTLMYPLLDAAPDQGFKFIADHQILITIWKLVVDWGTAITLLVMLLALYTLLKPDVPKMTIKATILGCIWAGLILVTSNLMLKNFGVVANLHGSFPAQVAAWTVMARSLWVLMLSLTIIRSARLPKTLGYVGVVLGLVGNLTLVPALTETMFMFFGPGMMVWSAWLGIAMLRRDPVTHPNQGWQDQTQDYSEFTEIS